MGIPGENDPRPLTNSELLLHEKLEKESYSLSTVFDLNFNATYKITNRFSVFARLNNFGFQQYQRWLGYRCKALMCWEVLAIHFDLC